MRPLSYCVRFVGMTNSPISIISARLSQSLEIQLELHDFRAFGPPCMAS